VKRPRVPKVEGTPEDRDRELLLTWERNVLADPNATGIDKGRASDVLMRVTGLAVKPADPRPSENNISEATVKRLCDLALVAKGASTRTTDQRPNLALGQRQASITLCNVNVGRPAPSPRLAQAGPRARSKAPGLFIFLFAGGVSQKASRRFHIPSPTCRFNEQLTCAIWKLNRELRQR